jgi:hypothetical protein
MMNLAGKKKYRVLVQDRYRRGGARFQYVLTVRKPAPDFYVAAIHSQNPGPGGTTVRRGGAAYLDVIIHNKDGWNGPITLIAEGLPPGLHALPTTIHGDTRGTFVLWADRDAAEWTGPIRLVATGKRGAETLRREVRPYTRVWTDPNMNSSRPVREQVQLERQWPEFKNAVNVLPLSLPGPLKLGTISIAPDRTEATVTLDVQPNARPGEYALSVLGQAQVPFAKDAKAATKPNTLVSQPARPLTLVVLPKK